MREYLAVCAFDGRSIDFFIGTDRVATAMRESMYNGRWVIRNEFSCIMDIDSYRNDIIERFKAKKYNYMQNRYDLEESK